VARPDLCIASWELEKEAIMVKSLRMGAALAALMGLPVIGAGCASTEIVPQVPTQDGVAVVQQSRLELRAEVQPGSHSVPNTLTPIMISVKNLADSSVNVSLDDIELELLEDGKTSEAVPPERIRPRPPAGLGLDPASPFAAQSPVTGGAGAAPSAGVPPPVPDANVTYSSDAGRGRDVAEEPLKRKIIDTAFTGGDIPSGQAREGLVYFQTPPKEVERLRLIVRVHAPDGQAPVEVLEIPFARES
jgi:hypothetical protein